jgi:hypothetical protein
VDAETSPAPRDQAIFVDQATDASLSSVAVLLKIDWFGQRVSATTAEVHDYLDERTGVLAAMLAKRAPGYAGLGFPDPRRLALTPSASADS